MKNFEYADEEIGQKEIILTVSSMMIGVGVLTLPRLVAKSTNSSDGWFSILLAGGITLGCAWLIAKLVSKFKKQTFFEYSSTLATKPVAYVLTFMQFCYFIMFCAYEIRAIANIAKQYLFDRTPVEIITLTFLLVVIYAVSGTRVGVIRLNVLFLPIVLLVTAMMLFFSIGLFDFENLRPFFVSDWKQILKGTQDSVYSLLGFETVLFYASLMNRPKEATKGIMIGVAISVVLYLCIFIFTIGIFTHDGTMNIMYPAIEIAKEIQIPGQFFERFESLFFVIWIMTIFNTTCMAMDISVDCLSSMYKSVNKRTWILILSPLIYLGCMIPKDLVEFATFGNLISYTGIVMAILVPAVLLLLTKIRKVNQHG